MAIDTPVNVTADSDAWSTFRERVSVSDARAAFLADWRVIRPLLDLAPADALAALRAHVTEMDEAAFELFYETVLLVIGRSVRRAGIVGITDAAEIARRSNAYFTAANAETALFGKLLALKNQIDAVRVRVSARPLSPAEQNTYTVGSALGDRLTAASPGALPGHATDESLGVFVELIAAYRASLADTTHDDRMRRMLLDGLESAFSSAGNAASLLHRASEAKTWFSLAATMYESRGEAENAKRCRDRAQSIDATVAGDIDAAIRPSLAMLIGESGASPATDPLDRITALTTLVTQSVHAGDTIGANASLAEAVAGLRALGYADPLDCGVDRAFVQWVRALPIEMHGTVVIRTLAAVAGTYFQLLGARSTLAEGVDPIARAHAHDVLPALRALSERIFAESNAALAEVAARWETVLDSALLASPAPEAADALATAARTQPTVPADDVQNRLFALGNTLYAALAEKDRRIDAGESLDDLLATGEAAVTEARALREPVYAALAVLLRGDVLVNSNRAAEALTELQAARMALASAFPQTPGGDAQQRGLDIQLLSLIVQAYAQLGDTPALFARTGEAISLIEHDRYKTSSPYQQGSFLKDRERIYMLGIVSALKTGDYGAMLERAELAKARAALRLRYLPAAPGDDIADLERRFRETSALVDAASTPELVLRRRRIWDLMEIARLRAAGTEIPEFSLPALRAVLAPNEAILYYYWLLPTVLLVAAIDATGVVVERVSLGDAENATFGDLIALLKTPRPLNDNLDAALQSFFATLLPPKIADAVKDKTRLIVSPHRALHIFPFHALKWDGRRLIERFAISYAPNVSVLLSPAVPELPPRVLLMGVGTFESVSPKPAEPLVPLPGVARELDAAADAYRDCGISSETLADGDLTRASLVAANDSGSLARFTTIVLATHGTSVFDADAVVAPMESHVYLHDGAFDGLDVSRLRLRANLVVLSACFSGQRAVDGRDGADLPGDDLFGLQAALNMAGAGAVLGCLWATDDDVAPSVMQAFHRARAEGFAPDAALQCALVAHLRTGKKSDPFYWANFFLSTMSGHTRSS